MLIFSTGPVSVSDNRATLLQQPAKDPVVFTAAAAVILNSNFLDNGRGDHDTVQIHVSKEPFTVLGNIASGLIRIDGVPLADPWKPLNVQMT